MDLKEIAIEFYNIGSVKFGQFTTKDNVHTPIYFDLRNAVAHPKLMRKLSKALWKLAAGVKTAQICGVPYTALPLATLISVEADLPMLLRRKEPKPYGMKKLVEGQYKPGENCVLIEDVVVSGSSIMETARDLEKSGLEVTLALVILDRSQGAKENLRNEGIVMKSLFDMRTFLLLLLEAGKISEKNFTDAIKYAKNCPVSLPSVVLRPTIDRLKMRFSERIDMTENSIAARLFQLMDAKKTNLCLAADLVDSCRILELADFAGPHVAVVKIHVDIIHDFSLDFVRKLKKLSQKHNFLLMEDRKFSDIGNTVAMQYARGMYKIAEWADLITAHCVAGPGILDALQKCFEDLDEERGIFLVTEMSSSGALTVGNYVNQSLTIADNYGKIIAGHVCQANIFSDPGLIQLTPGVKLISSKDSLGQQYNTPKAVVNSGADLIVVGRGVTEAKNQLEAVLEYRKHLWEAYEDRLGC